MLSGQLRGTQLCVTILAEVNLCYKKKNKPQPAPRLETENEKMFHVGRCPTFCHRPSGVLQHPPSRPRKVFCSAERCSLPCRQPPQVLPALPTSSTLFFLTGYPWLFASNSKFWSWRSRLLGESCVHICRLRPIQTHQLVLCALLQLAT